MAADGRLERKSMLYRTGVEYGDFAMNHVLGCSHGCLYPCYAYLMQRRFGRVASRDEWLRPRLVANALELLEGELPRLKPSIGHVQLCFTTDPFMVGHDEVSAASLAAVRTLNDAGVRCVVLSKGILPAALAGLSPLNEYGVTIVSLDEGFRRRMEPGAAPVGDRLASLRALHDSGCRTWVSVEPYPTPNVISQDLERVLEAVSFADRIVFGRANYSRDVSSYGGHRAFYREQAEKAASFCARRGIGCLVKRGTAE
jgi:DNA repair photolyase